MLFLVSVLANDCMNNSFKDVLLWHDAFHVFDQTVCIICLIILEVVNNKVKSGLRNDINERWQDLEGILSSSEYHEVVSQ